MEKKVENNNIDDGKIWGIYNTSDDKDFADKLSEIDIWRKINNFIETINYAQRLINKPSSMITYEQIKNAEYNLEYLIYYTRKFGVKFDKKPSAKEHIERSGSFIAWYNFWYYHFDSMTKEEYDQFVEDKFAGKDISKYMPKGSWKDTYEEDVTKH